MMQSRQSFLVPAAVFAVALCLPFVASGYRLFQLTMIVDYAIALLGLNLLTGYNGQISIGHGAFYAIGAYTTAILTVEYGVPYPIAIPIGGALCLVVGFLFGLPALRLRGVHLALATFALAVVTPQLLKYPPITPWTHGAQGMSLNPPAWPAWLPLGQDQRLYYTLVLVAAVMFLLARNLLRSRVGKAIVAVRDQPVAAAAMGIDTAMLKSKTFGLSALYTGIAGALAAMVTQYVSPDTFNFFLSVSFVVGIVVGGVASLPGALYGAAFIELVPDFASGISKAAPSAIYGLCLTACVFLMPAGVHGLLRSAWSAVAERLGGAYRVESRTISVRNHEGEETAQ
jgi:branched-chain amino acid transport system permease protein